MQLQLRTNLEAGLQEARLDLLSLRQPSAAGALVQASKAGHPEDAGNWA